LSRFLSFPRRLIAQLIKPFRDQKPASVLVREMARKEWKLILANLFCSILQAVTEGLTLGVMFFAVEVLSKPAGSVLAAGSYPIFNAFPQVNQWISQISNLQAFSLLLCLAVLLKLIQGGAMALGTISIGYFGNRVSRQLTSRLHAHILDYTYSCASRYRVGDLLYVTGVAPSTIIADIKSYSNLLSSVFLLFTYLAVLIRLSPWLLVAAVLMGAVSLFIQQKLLPLIGKRAQVAADLNIELGSRMAENIQGLRLLHSSGYLNEAVTEVERQAINYELNARGQVRLNSINAPVTLILPILMIAGIAWIAILIFGSRSTGVLPSLVTFVVALQRLNGSIGGLSDIIIARKTNLANMDILNAFLFRGDKDFRRKDGVAFDGITKEIELKNVELTYPSATSPALQSINITLPRGSTIALVGSSGAGKSSIADLLAGLYEPTKGRVLIDGKDLRDYDPSTWQKRIGVVSQDTFLFNATIANNISFGRPESTMADIEFAADQAQASKFIANLPDGYDTIIGERGYRLSGGQRQRLSLARAILREPDLLVLDEATSALDTESERLVQQAIDQFDRKYTILVIAHRLSTIVNADRIYVLDHGRVIEEGSHHELLESNGRYSRLWQQQSKVPKTRKVPT
jgi:ATP-binding cassette subfamily B protein/subfamily B ATP-binding cassette protein MsbA